MIRPVLAATAALSAGAALAASPVALKPNPVDPDGVITLGELFEGTASTAVVAAGPKPGGTVVLEAARVQAAARAAGLAWANPAGVRRIIVRSGTAAAASASAQAAGTEVLTYARSLNTGAVVTAEDLAWAPAPRAPADAPEDADAAIGLQLRKPVRAGAPVSGRDLTAARVIAKNDAVTVRYRSGPVRLTLQGKALSGAAVGEAVRIQSAGARTEIEAVAAGPGLAVVGPEALQLRGAAALASR